MAPTVRLPSGSTWTRPVVKNVPQRPRPRHPALPEVAPRVDVQDKLIPVERAEDPVEVTHVSGAHALPAVVCESIADPPEEALLTFGPATLDLIRRHASVEPAERLDVRRREDRDADA